MQAALRLRDRLGFRGEGERGVYLCHTFCELGATPLHGVPDDIHDFLVTHPTEVLVVVNQDYVSPAAARRGQGQRVRAAAAEGAGVRAAARPRAEPARGELLPGG